MMRKLGWAIAALTACGIHGVALAANCATVTVSPAAPAIPQWNPLDGAAQEAPVRGFVAHARNIAPHADRDDNRVGNCEPRPEMLAEDTANDPRRCVDGVQLEDHLFDRVRRLHDHEHQEEDDGSGDGAEHASHVSHLRACAARWHGLKAVPYNR